MLTTAAAALSSLSSEHTQPITRHVSTTAITTATISGRLAAGARPTDDDDENKTTASRADAT